MKTHQVTELDAGVEMINEDFEHLVKGIIQSVDKGKLEELKRDFHTRLRITPTQPDDNTDLIEYLWDFFYDWCVFEERLPDKFSLAQSSETDIWNRIKDSNLRGIYSVLKTDGQSMKVKDLYSGKSFVIRKNPKGTFVGIGKGDILEGRLVGPEKEKKKEFFRFLRRPSYHPSQVHSYVKAKIRQFKKSKDFTTYQTWLWILVGMYLKHRLYSHMPVIKIYDDNSRI